MVVKRADLVRLQRRGKTPSSSTVLTFEYGDPVNPGDPQICAWREAGELRFLVRNLHVDEAMHASKDGRRLRQILATRLTELGVRSAILAWPLDGDA
jgi:hypothetical protein